MNSSLPIPPPGFDDLSTDEQVRYVEALWDRIAATPEEIRVPDWHRQLVSDRLAEYQSNPGAGRPWREVRDELLREITGSRRTPD